MISNQGTGIINVKEHPELYIVESKVIVDYEVIGSGVISVHRTRKGAFKSLFEADWGDFGELNEWYSSEEGERKVVKETIME